MNKRDVEYQTVKVVGTDKNNNTFDFSLGLTEHVFDVSLIDATVSGKPLVVNLEFNFGKNTFLIPLPFISVLYGTDMTAGGKRMKFDEVSNNYNALNFKKSDPQNNKKSFEFFVKNGNTEIAKNLWDNFRDKNLSDDKNISKKLFPIIEINSEQYNNFLCHALATEYMLAINEEKKELANSIANIDIMKQFDLFSYIDNSKEKNDSFVFSMIGNKNQNMHLVKFGNNLYSMGLQPKDNSDKSFYKKFDDSNYIRFYDIINDSLEAIEPYNGAEPNTPSSNE